MNNQLKISQFVDDSGMWTYILCVTYVHYRIHQKLPDIEIKFICLHSLEQHSVVYKLQNDQHRAIMKRDNIHVIYGKLSKLQETMEITIAHSKKHPSCNVTSVEEVIESSLSCSIYCHPICPFFKRLWQTDPTIAYRRLSMCLTNT